MADLSMYIWTLGRKHHNFIFWWLWFLSVSVIIYDWESRLVNRHKLSSYIVIFVGNYGISNTIVLRTPIFLAILLHMYTYLTSETCSFKFITQTIIITRNLVCHSHLTLKGLGHFFYASAFRRRRHYVFGLSVRLSVRSLKYPLLTCT